MEYICARINIAPIVNKFECGENITTNEFAIIYHGGCQDGTAAAAIFKHYLNKNYPDHSVELIYGVYHDAVDIERFRNKDVYFLDFSYSKEIIEKIIDVAWGVTVLDHHKSAYNNLFPALEGKLKDHFKLDKCGAMIAWEFTHHKEPAPAFIDLVNQRDMWQKQNDDADSLYLAISTDYPKNEDKLNIFVDLINDNLNPDTPLLNSLLLKGKSYLDYNRKVVENIAYNHYSDEIIDHNGVKQSILVCNCQGMWASDVGEILAKQSPTGIGMTWCLTEKGLKVSIRVKDDVDWDAGAYAKSAGGGGGHARSAGFLIKVKPIVKL